MSPNNRMINQPNEEQYRWRAPHAKAGVMKDVLITTPPPKAGGMAGNLMTIGLAEEWSKETGST